MSKLEESKLFNTLVGGMQERGVYTDLETGISHNVIFWKHSDFPNAHLYISTSLTTLMQLETVIESVILAEKLIGNVENINKSTEIESSDLLKYFVRNWVGNYVTVYEVVLQLINVIFELGYLKREASKANIERDNVFKEDLFLFELVKPICDLVWSDMSDSGLLLEANNKIKHRGVFKYKDIDELNTKEFWSRFGVKDDSDIDFEIDKGLIKLSILKDIKKRNQKIIDSIFKLLEYLSEVFEIRFEEKRKGFKSHRI